MDTRFFPWIALGGGGRKSGLGSDAVENRGPSRGRVSRRPLGEDERTSDREASEGFCLLLPGFPLFFLVGSRPPDNHVLFILFHLFIFGRISLCSPGWPRTADLKHTMIHLPQLSKH